MRLNGNFHFEPTSVGEIISVIMFYWRWSRVQ
jgi:hypothetical protein